ncbi:MAG: TIGR01212 family radical SAM protein, partial [Aeromonas sp.]
RPTLLAPVWCENRWLAMTDIANKLAKSGPQGHALGRPFIPATPIDTNGCG